MNVGHAWMHSAVAAGLIRQQQSGKSSHARCLACTPSHTHICTHMHTHSHTNASATSPRRPAEGHAVGGQLQALHATQRRGPRAPADRGGHRQGGCMGRAGGAGQGKAAALLPLVQGGRAGGASCALRLQPLGAERARAFCCTGPPTIAALRPLLPAAGQPWHDVHLVVRLGVGRTGGVPLRCARLPKEPAIQPTTLRNVCNAITVC